MNLCEYLSRQVAQRPEKPAIRTDDVELTYTDLDRQARQVAAWLDDHGVEEGDRVAVYLPNVPVYAPLVFGIWHVGAVASPLNVRFGVDDLAFVLDDIRPNVLVTSPAFADATAALEERVEHLDHVVELAGDGSLAGFPEPGAAPPRTKRMDDDTAIVMHTSGTTGDPKGVIQTHRNIGAEVDSGITVFGLSPDDTALVAMPLFHVGGLHGAVMMTLFSGGTVALLQGGWDAEAFVRSVERFEATYSGLIPTMMVDALDTEAIEECDVSSLEFCFFGGSPAPEPLIESFESAFGVDLTNYYGQTENAGVSVTNPVDEHLPPGALGKPSPAVRHRIVEPGTTDPVEQGEQGELLLRGDIITPGYWERPERNDALFTDGWLHTEDIVRADEDGFLYYVDRKDDIIHSGGEKVPPSKVENVLQDMEGVDAVAVFGTPHERWGEAVTAALVADDGLTEADVEAFCEDREDLPGYMKPRVVAFVEEFPRTGSQKIDKVALAEQVGS
jgi:acyl-CoA synthetase (AMP-forming)/AMP-acid ligase II